MITMKIMPSPRTIAFAAAAFTALTVTTAIARETAPTTGPLPVYFYFIPGCPKCKQAKAAVTAAEKRFGPSILVRRFDLARDEKAFDIYIATLDRLRIRTTPNLLVVMGDNVFLEGEDKIIDLIIPTLARVLQARNRTKPDGKQPPVIPDMREPPETPAPHIDRTDILMLSLAALTDGFNPCAFATVILFVSMLAAVGRSRREVTAVGASFLLAVFLAYLAIGLTFFKAMAMMKHLRILSRIISWAALAMVSIAGALSLVDGVRALRTGGHGKMILVLPDFLKNRIRGHLTRTAHSRNLIAAAFIAGVAVSFLESACTGQVYFPLILKLVQDGTQPARGILLLLWYNILFMLPLIAVFLLTIVGVSSQTIAGFARKHAWLTKFALAAVFFAMAVWLAID